MSATGFFGPDSASWRVHRETLVLFGGARALLMHAAHPLVIAGARATGFYERDPWRRLERTLRLTYTLTFGTREDATRAAEHINRVHESVHGVDEVTGKPYDAFDPDLLLWVHACLVDSALLYERLLVGELDDAGRQQFHEEQMLAAEVLRLPRAHIPPTVAGLRAYIDGVIASDDLLVTDGARAVLNLISNPPPEAEWRPILRVVARWAFGTLHPKLRAMYGLRWSPAHDALMRASMMGLKRARPLIPAQHRLIEPARLAEQRARGAVADVGSRAGDTG